MRHACLVFMVALVAGELVAIGEEEVCLSVADVLRSKTFWEKDGLRNGRKWSGEEAQELRKLATQDEDLPLRLRANKVRVDLAGQSRFNVGPNDDTIAAAGFQHLENHLDDARIKKFIHAGASHYAVSRHSTTGDTWFLVENLLAEPRGGLNLRWDREKQEIVEIVGWGSFEK